MASGPFTPDDAGIQAILLGPEISQAVAREAARAMVIARGLAADFVVTGDYEASFGVRTEVVELQQQKPHRAVAGILENTSDHAVAVEWGNSHDHTAHHVLGRTLAVLDDS